MYHRQFLFLVFLSFVQLTGFTQNKTKTIQKQKAEIENLNTQISQLESAHQKEVDNYRLILQEQTRLTHEEIDGLEEKLEALKNKVQLYDEKLQELHRIINNLQDQCPTCIKMEELVSIPNNEEIVEFVDQEASFPGGTKALMEYLSINIKYPEAAINIAIQGKVYIQFVVLKTGAISDVQILRGVSKELDDEAKRVVQMMPNWIPAIQNNVKVNSRVTIPINFQLK